MDQYLVYGEKYKVVRDAIAKAVVDGDVEQIEETCKVSKLTWTHSCKLCFDIMCNQCAYLM